MDIKEVLTKLDIGMSNIEIEGKVTYTEVPEHREGESKKAKGGHYDFWSQTIHIDDDTGAIECSISVKDENDGIEKGVVARVKGKLAEWQGVRKIQGKLIAISKGDRVIDVQQERAEEYFEEKAKEEKIETEQAGKVIQAKAGLFKPDNNVWEAKDLRIARECAVKAVTELACAGLLKGKEFFPFANTIVKYIYNGKVNGKKKKSILRNDREPLEIIDDDAPFPVEEIENAVNEKEKNPVWITKIKKEEMPSKAVMVKLEKEEGSSYNNALPFKGKRKAVSKAEDFLAPGDMPD